MSLRHPVAFGVFVQRQGYLSLYKGSYGVATISRLLKMMGLFCKISSLLQGSFAKGIYNFKERTNRSHPIFVLVAGEPLHQPLS